MLKKILLAAGTALFCLLIAVTVGFFGGRKESEITEDGIPLIEKSAVMVECGESVGSGNIYRIKDDSFTIVTAGHIFENETGSEPGITVTFYDGEKAKGSVVKADKQLDVAFLEVLSGDIRDADTRYKAVYEDDFTDSDIIMPAVGDVIYLRNSVTGTNYAGTMGLPSVYSEDFGRNMILCYCEVDEGMSGTGLFDEEYGYCGMLLGGTKDSGAVCLDVKSISSFFLE